MKLSYASFLLCLVFLSFQSCSKNNSDDNDPPPTPPVLAPKDTVYSHLVERLVYRYLKDDVVVEETYSLKYDEQDRLIETRREDEKRPLVRFQYTGDNIVAISEFTTQGNLAATFVANSSLFITPDTMMFYFTRDITPASSLDTIYQVFEFKKGIIQTGTFSMASDNSEYESSYQGLIFEYDQDGNVAELGWQDTYQNYQVHMNVTSVDQKKNPVYHSSLISYVFFFSRINPELTMSKNNITGIGYPDGNAIDLEYTYNASDFPLTVKDKTQNLVRYEFTYKIE